MGCLFLSTALAGGSYAGTSIWEGKHDFRGINWGMSRAEVLAREKNHPVTEEDKQGSRIISYVSSLYGLRANLTYTFTRDKCWYARYEVKGLDVKDFEDLKQVYKKLENDLYKQYGGSIVSLHMEYDSILGRTWKTDDADILLYLQPGPGKDNRLELSLSFLCRDLMNEVLEISHYPVYGF